MGIKFEIDIDYELDDSYSEVLATVSSGIVHDIATQIADGQHRGVIVDNGQTIGNWYLKA